MHLTTRQHGAYTLLLMHYYGTGRPLPLDDDTVRTITRLQTPEWKADRAAVMAYFDKEADGWHQKRADKELASANVRYERAVKGAKAKHANKHALSSAQEGVKHDASTDASTCLNGQQAPANPNPNPTPAEKSPTGFSSDRRPRSAARAEPAAPTASPGWEQTSEKWAAYRQKIGEGAWRAWFADAMVNGSETVLWMPSEFSREQVVYRYAKDLSEHFGENVSIRFKPTAGAA